MSQIVLTFDIDWTPDFVIEKIANHLIEKKIKATWFVTHSSPFIEKLFKFEELFDFGIHPNFFTNSTQGRNEDEVMLNILKILPKSKILRTHSLLQSTYLMGRLCKNYGIEIDVSLFLPKTPHLEPHKIRYFKGHEGLIRIPYFWEDDIEMNDQNTNWNPDSIIEIPGLKVFDFHPIHIFLNSNNIENYEKLKQIGPMITFDYQTITPFINSQYPGTNNFFMKLCDYIKSQKTSHNISEIADKWRNEH